MNDPSPNAEEIQAQMRRTRQRLRGEVDDAVEGAKQLTDWRYYVRQFPWASLGVAAGLGYMAVPRRLEVMRPDAKTLNKLAKEQKLVIDPSPPGARKPSILDTVLTMTGNVLLRAGIAYASQQMGKVMGQQAAEPDVGPRPQRVPK